VQTTVVSTVKKFALTHRHISDTTKAGLNRARRKGKTLGRPRVAVDVQKARDLQAKGMGLRGVADKAGWSLSILCVLGGASIA